MASSGPNPAVNSVGLGRLFLLPKFKWGKVKILRFWYLTNGVDFGIIGIVVRILTSKLEC